MSERKLSTILITKALLVDADKNILVLIRSDTHPRYPLKPDLPGGEVDEGEELTESIAREIFEETGIKIGSSECNLFYAASSWRDSQSRIRLFYIIWLKRQKPLINISWEHCEAKWIPHLDAELDHPVEKEGLQYAIEHKLI